jgi:hypothetical protein
MNQSFPVLSVDDRGVWREDRPGARFGIAWDDIYSVTGFKLDGVTEVFTGVYLDFEYGEFIELFRDWPGFTQVVEAITARLPGIHANWWKQVEQLEGSDPPLVVWRRP